MFRGPYIPGPYGWVVAYAMNLIYIHENLLNPLLTCYTPCLTVTGSGALWSGDWSGDPGLIKNYFKIPGGDAASLLPRSIDPIFFIKLVLGLLRISAKLRLNIKSISIKFFQS